MFIFINVHIYVYLSFKTKSTPRMDTNVVTYLSLSIALLLYQLLLLLCWCPYIPFVGKLSCEGERRGQRTSYYQLTCRRVQDVSSAWKSPYAFSRNVICPYESLSASTRIVLTDFSQILATTGNNICAFNLTIIITVIGSEVLFRRLPYECVFPGVER